MKLCHKCNTEWTGLNQPKNKEECQKCGYDLHVCLNCRFYDISKPNQCAEGVDEAVVNKERFNFCDSFEFTQKNKDSRHSTQAVKTKENWNNLFK